MNMTDKELIKMALDALIETVHLAGEYGTHLIRSDKDKGHAYKTIERLRAALAQTERAECDGGQCGIGGYCKQCPKTQPEPIAVWELQEGGWDTIADRDWMESLPVGTKLYTAPPQREWVSLTVEELAEISEFHFHGAFSGREIYEDIENKLKEKNT